MNAVTSPTDPADTPITNRRFGLVLFVLIVLTFPWAVVGLKVPLFRDFGLYSYPIAHYLREAVRRGEWPLWNPLSFCGLPFLAQWNTMVLYPLSLLYILLPLAQGLTWFCLLHVWIGGFGMFRIAREWTNSSLAAAVAGTIYALNGVMLDTGLWPCSIGPLAWAPWVLLAARNYWNRGGRALLPALAAAVLLMLAPFPEIIFMTWLLAGALWLADELHDPREKWRRLGRLLLLVILTAGLCAVQLVPFFELLSLSQRGQDPTRTLWPMPPTGWANLLIPVYLCVPAHHGVYFQPNQSFVASYYMGIGTVVLAVVAALRVRDRRAVVALLAVVWSLVMALGQGTPVFEWANRLVPPLRLMRFSIKYVFLMTLSLPIATAFAVAVFDQARKGVIPRRKMVATASSVTAAVILLVILLLAFARSYPLPGHDWRVTAVSALSRVSFLLLIMGAAFQWLHTTAGRRAALWTWALVVLWAADLLTHKPIRTPWADPWVLEPGILWEHWNFPTRPAHGVARVMFRPADEIRFGQFVAGGPNDEYVGQRLACSFNCNLFDGIPKVVGFFPLKPAPIYEVQRMFNDSPEELLAPLADFLSVAHVNVRGRFYEWEPRPEAMPMLTMPTRVRFASPQETLAALRSSDFRPREEVYLPEHARGQIPEKYSAGGRLIQAEFSAQRVQAVVESEGAVLLVWNQTYYPHWRAYVDGTRVTIWPANHAFQAVLIPAGRHTVEWCYEDETFRRSLILSAVTLVLAGVIGYRVTRASSTADPSRCAP